MAQKRILEIYYVFSKVDMAMDDPLIDVEGSVQNYKRLCQETLERSYPDAQIEIFCQEDDSPSLDTQVISWGITNEFEDRIEVEFEDIEELETLNALCERVHNNFEWIVQKKTSSIKQFSRRSNIPVSVLYWLCHTSHLKDAFLVDDVWHIPNILLKNDYNALFHFYEDVKGKKLTEFTGNEILIPFRNDLSEEVILLHADQSLFCITNDNEGHQIHLSHFLRKEDWFEGWSYPQYIDHTQRLVDDYNVQLQLIGKTDPRNHLLLSRAILPPIILQHAINDFVKQLSAVAKDVELSLQGGPIWNEANDHIYQKNEERFCLDILEPLLNQMGFKEVRYTHGQDERGRDFVFYKDTLFGSRRYYALQAKAGKVSGGANSLIDKIIAQIDDMFALPYPGQVGNVKENHASVVIVAVSGNFTREARDKINRKVSPERLANLYFLDKEIIISLINEYWRIDK